MFETPTKSKYNKGIFQIFYYQEWNYLEHYQNVQKMSGYKNFLCDF